MGKRLTAPSLGSRKVADGGEPIVMVTAADYPSARWIGDTDADMILVGDSLAMVVLGYDDTLQVSIDDMAHHTAAVARANPKQLIVADLPWMAYHVSPEDTLRNAAKLIRAPGARQECISRKGACPRRIGARGGRLLLDCARGHAPRRGRPGYELT